MEKNVKLTTKKFLTRGRKRYGNEFKEAAAWIAHQLLDSENCDYENVIEELHNIWWDEFADTDSFFPSLDCEEFYNKLIYD